MQDPEKIRRKIQELNRDGGDWVEAEGNHALTKVEGEFRGGKVTFFPSSGIPLKVFISRRTGEIKIFPAIMFERDV